MASQAQVGNDHVYGDLRVKFFDWTGDTSYPAGGESLTATDLGLRVISHVQGSLAVNSTNAVHLVYDHANFKLQAFQSTTGAPSKLVEVADTTSLASYVGRLTVHGY